ncbi:aminotransferase class V-fold PLP-dependent enzyme [Streptomyces sp. ODS05-4]|uniref:aminotransferase class V-fold PLP-dependent enzyme n=1 Tax=Streptomyces sp. ODS05-4 TaxID=2944939 RepID=UPI00210EF43B|nr:aminotransferase class V-fold PLP-dependent enzyme [Streptomyces sp. ODS05-4]
MRPTVSVPSPPSGPRPPVPLRLPDGRPAADAWSLDPAVRHLNHGSFGAVPRAAQQAQHSLRDEMNAHPGLWFPELPERVAKARAAVARFLRAAPDELALVPNASAGASVLYGCLPDRPGGEIVVTDHGYGAVTMGAERLARRWGGTVRTARVPLDADADTACEAILAEVGERTGLLVVDQVTSPTARRLPVERVGAEARRRGVPFLVDGAHAPGLFADPLHGLECDVWTGNLHKFGCAPPGAAALVARSPLRTSLHPLIDSWGAREPFPQRFDFQATHDATSHLAAPAAFALIEETWGWDAVRAYQRDLAAYGRHVVATAFEALTGEDASAQVGMPVDAMKLVRLPGPLAAIREQADALRGRAARELGVAAAFTAFRGTGYLRLSAHAYNTPADYEDFAARCVPVLAGWARAAAGR